MSNGLLTRLKAVRDHYDIDGIVVTEDEEGVLISIEYDIHPEDDMFVIECLNFPCATQGSTEEEAIENLRKAATLWIETALELMTKEVLGEEITP